MPRPVSRHPTELELEILKVLWERGSLPVRSVREALAPSRDLAYTSVMTVMNIMVDKRYLTRKKAGVHYVYTARVTRTATAGKMLRDVVERAFNGSAEAVMVNLLDAGDLDEVEIRELRKLLDQKLRGDG